jgi:sugar/nucleoside kinase (ribokinase family)
MAPSTEPTAIAGVWCAVDTTAAGDAFNGASLSHYERLRSAQLRGRHVARSLPDLAPNRRCQLP